MKVVGNKMASKPFLKWAGGKYKLVEFIKENFPDKPYGRFVEPFAGSAAVTLNVEFESYLINDINTDLINLYKILKSDKLEFIKYTKSYFNGEYNNEKSFYELRETFNHTDDIKLKSALFIYLNRHAFNGLCRYNNKGGFNVPFGRYKTTYFPEKEMLAFLEKSDRIELRNTNFQEIFKEVTSDDLIYCDPPYIPLTETASFTSYSKNNFRKTEQEILSNEVNKAKELGCTVLVSNHNVPLAHELYKDADIHMVDVQRNIAASGEKRLKVSEILAVFTK